MINCLKHLIVQVFRFHAASVLLYLIYHNLQLSFLVYGVLYHDRQISFLVFGVHAASFLLYLFNHNLQLGHFLIR